MLTNRATHLVGAGDKGLTLFFKTWVLFKPHFRLVLRRYMAFEAQFGDLASIYKIDKRIVGTESDERDSSMLIERYKYIDLLPCSKNELRSMGYSPVRLSSLLFINIYFGSMWPVAGKRTIQFCISNHVFMFPA